MDAVAAVSAPAERPAGRDLSAALRSVLAYPPRLSGVGRSLTRFHHCMTEPYRESAQRPGAGPVNAVAGSRVVCRRAGIHASRIRRDRLSSGEHPDGRLVGRQVDARPRARRSELDRASRDAAGLRQPCVADQLVWPALARSRRAEAGRDVSNPAARRFLHVWVSSRQ